MNLGAALVGLFDIFVVKTAVMILAAFLLARLWRISFSRGPRRLWLGVAEEHRGKFKVLTFGIIFFMLSELGCAVEIYILGHTATFFACWHSITSPIGMALTAVGAFILFDWRYFHVMDTSAPCIAAKTCRTCSKRATGVCRFRTVIVLNVIMIFLMGVPVFFNSTVKMDADTKLYALPFASLNRLYDESIIPWVKANYPHIATDPGAYFLPHEMLVIEFRILPVVAMALALIALISLAMRKEDTGIIILLLSSGVLAYSYLETVIYGLTRQMYFGALAHETSEVFFLLIFSGILRRMFPRFGAQEAPQPVAVT
jgi:hypothetical protein